MTDCYLLIYLLVLYKTVGQAILVQRQFDNFKLLLKSLLSDEMKFNY